MKKSIGNMKILLFFILLNLSFGVFVSEEDATVVARNIYSERRSLHSDLEFSISSVELVKNEGKRLIYVFHLNPRGFIMVPADNQAIPNLAFGFEHDFITTDMPGNLSALMDNYKLEISSMITNQLLPSDEILNKWNYYLGDNIEINRTRDVSPLLDAEFNQSGSWNNGVEAGIGFNGPVGCVAVSMAQIMHYWKYPEVGVGSNYYTEDDFGYIEVSFEDAFYDFENMAATYATSASQLLLFHAGVSVNMDYDWSGSGAWVTGYYPSAFYSMENFFAYDSDISYHWKDNYSVTEYRNLIKNELDYNRPIISQGYDNGGYGGHAWNIDGYSGNNVHCNWGWGGSSNGYFNLNSMGGFPNDQAVIVNLLPQMEDPFALFEFSTNEDFSVHFTDLSGILNEIQILEWNWDFGDGSTATSSSPTHIYEEGGNYEVSLVVTNIYGVQSEPHTEFIELQTAMSGDVNGDLVLNILDIVILTNFILGTDSPIGDEFQVADLNGDSVLNILDIVILSNNILGT